MLLNSLTINITPNAVPTWSGRLPALVFDSDIRVIAVEVPLTQPNVKEYEYVSLDLWVDRYDVSNETEVGVSGILYNTRSLVKLSNSVAITPCKEIILGDEDTENDTYDLIISETFGTTVTKLFEGTGWEVKIDPRKISDFPVVTEVAPILTLNGSKLEQLNQLLGLLSPNDLWGQGLSFFVNPFEGVILITSPLHGDSNINTIPIGDLKLEELNVQKTPVDMPEALYIQESESALLRATEHFEGVKAGTESYAFNTDQVVTEQDEDVVTINASVSGERFSVGNLVLTEVTTTRIDESTDVSTRIGYGGPFNTEPVINTYRMTKKKFSEITTTTEYRYMVGPPYSVEEASVYSAHMEGGNNCFSKSEGGIRQQLSRDFGSVIIDKENYPEVLGTSDGIRAIRKLVVTEESSKDSVTFDSGSVGGSFEFPGPIDTSDPVITTVEEVYMYDDDGNLTGDRVGKKVTEDTGYVMTNTFRVYTPITEQLTGVLTYSVETKYNDKDEVISSSTTGVQIDTVAADRSGPVPESAFMSVEGNESLREKKLKAYSSNIIKKLNEDKSISDLSEVPTGGFYVTVENLTLEEIESYLNDYYVLDASMNYVASFSTKHADVRGLIGGHIQLTSGTLNRPEFHDATTSAKLELKDSGFLSAINCTPFRVTGIVLDWDRETTPEISVAMCQLV